MRKSVHIPPELIEVVDQRAAALQMSRNRFIVRAIRTALGNEEKWSPEFIDALSVPLPDESVDDLFDVIRKGRMTDSKPPAKGST
jgi:hypothetical protein